MHYEIQRTEDSVDLKEPKQYFLAKRDENDEGKLVEVSSDELENIIKGLETLCHLLKLPGVKIIRDGSEYVKRG